MYQQGNMGNHLNGNPWGSQGMARGRGGHRGGFGGHNKSHWQKNAFYNQNQRWGQGYPQMPQWQNQHNCYIPPIQFYGQCRKCHGTGSVHRHGMMIPCRKCYQHQGICPKCYGGGTDYFTGRPCSRCQGGRWQMGMRYDSSDDETFMRNGGQMYMGGRGGGFGGHNQMQGGFGGQMHGQMPGQMHGQMHGQMQMGGQINMGGGQHAHMSIGGGGYGGQGGFH